MTKEHISRLKYTLGIIHCPETDEILLLNREKKPWMGRWNGVGGKLDPEESPYDCIVRETEEETGLNLPQYISRGVMLWLVDNSSGTVGEETGGMYLFTAEVSAEEVKNYPTPTKFDKEGILDWKKLAWVLDEHNLGIVDNITVVLKDLFKSNETDLFTTTYCEGKMVNCVYQPGKNTKYL